MAESAKSTSTKSSSAAASSGPKKGEFVTEGEAAYEAGWWGTRDNPFADEEFSLTTGPDAPLQDLQGNPVELDEHIEKAPAE